MAARRRLAVVIVTAAVLLLAACVSKPRPYTQAWEDGKSRRTGMLAGGKQSGRWTYWYANGAKQAEGRFLADRQDGTWTWWYPNGQMQSTGAFAGDGQRVGEWVYWHETGKRQSQGAYGTATTAVLRPGEGRADRQHGLWRYWRADGTPAAEGWFVNGSRMLVWTYHGADGHLAEQGAYWNGAKIGPWRELSDGALAWVDHGCPAGYGCYREPAEGAPRRWGMLKDQRPTGAWIVFGEDGSPRYADLLEADAPQWMAWRQGGTLLGVGRGGAVAMEQYFTAAGTTMVASAGATAPSSGGETLDEAKAMVAEGAKAARGELVVAVAAAPVASPAPALKPAAVAGISLAPVSPLPGWWTPKEEGVAKALIKAYTAAASKASLSYDGWGDESPPASPGRKDLLGKPLVQTRLLSASGEVIDLADFHGSQKVVLVILRGFSGQVCLYCTTQTAALIDALPRFTAGGARVVLLYPGAAEAVPAFIQAVQSLGREIPKDLTVAIDPDLTLVRGLGIEDTLAKPTTIILDKQGLVRWTYVGANKTDRPAVDTLLGQVAKLP
jgi:antitoxin component YwqK of YwqJK toxin-antitoxin module/peroxiredoxin